MNKKIYLILPTYRDQNGNLLKGNKLFIVSLALHALSSIIPNDWEKEFCFEYFDDVDFESNASVIGISCMGYDIFRGIEIAEEFRKRGKIILFGGVQTHISKDYVKNHCDAIIHGNPDFSDMSKILKDAEINSLNKEYFCKISFNYMFDYSILDLKKVFFTPVLLNSGCKNSCDFCSTAVNYKGQYRLRKIKHVIEELGYLYRITRKIAFVDTNIYNNRRYLLKVCEAILRHKFNFIWGAQSTIDIGDDVEVLNLLKKTGCRILYIGIETTDQSNLDAVNKNHNVDLYQQRIYNIHKAGIKIAGFFIFGMDNDNIDTSKSLANFIIKNKIALPMINILVPTPGTKIYYQLKKEKRILMKDEQDFLKNNPAYNSSFNLCFYIPKNMTPMQVEDGFLDLLKRLSGYLQIIKRSISKDIPLSMFLLYLNWLFRKEYLQLKKNREKLQK